MEGSGGSHDVAQDIGSDYDMGEGSDEEDEDHEEIQRILEQIEAEKREDAGGQSAAAGGSAGVVEVAAGHASAATAGNTKDSSDEKGSPGGDGEKKSPLQASAIKAKGKAYNLWALNFIKRACAYRDIPRMSQEKDKAVMAAALRAQDERMGRPSPFFDDLDGIVCGECSMVARGGGRGLFADACSCCWY